MQYTIKTKVANDPQAIETGQEFKSLDKALANVFDLIDYVDNEVSEILICNDRAAIYSIKPIAPKQFIVQELY